MFDHRLSSERVLGEIISAIDTGKPYSAIRLGDGEGRVMGYPNHVSLFELVQIWKIWFGHSFVSDTFLDYLKAELKKACHEADIIGLPMAVPDFSSDFGRVEAVLNSDGFIGPKTQIANSGFHLDWQADGLYDKLLKNRQFVGFIGSRDIGVRLEQTFNIHRALWVDTPPEMRYADLPEQDMVKSIFIKPHFPDRFFEVMQFGVPYIMGNGPGTITLVGAGVLGKIYCAEIKRKGGIAIDVGSMMDLWAGLKTRNMPQFDGLKDLTV